MRIVFKFWDFENYYYVVPDAIYENLTTPHYLNANEPEFEPLDPDEEEDLLISVFTAPEEFDYELGSEFDFYHMKFRINNP